MGYVGEAAKVGETGEVSPHTLPLEALQLFKSMLELLHWWLEGKE